MEENKQRGIFYSKSIRILTTVLFFMSIGVFTAAVLFLSDLFRSGFQPEDFGHEGSLVYEKTSQCGSEVEQFIQPLTAVNDMGQLFMTNGKLDPDKKIDITNTDAVEKKQNKYTTYTVENIKKLIDEGYIDNIRGALYEIENGYYEELLAEELSAEEQEQLREVTEENTEELRGYSDRFKFLYKNRVINEGITPESGEYLADYAKKNPDKVSLMDLYEMLIRIAEKMQFVEERKAELEIETNIMYVVENTDTGVVYTNVPEWKNGYDASVVEDIDKLLFLQNERRNGELIDLNYMKLSKAEKIIQNYYRTYNLSGPNEKITIMLNTDYPVNDVISANSRFYSQYAGMGRAMLVCALISFLTGILSLLLLTMQTGRIREDGELHMGSVDRIPAEVMLAAGAVLAILMFGLGIVYIDNDFGGEVLVAVLVVLGEIALGSLLLTSYLSIIRRIKGRLLWKSSLSYTIFKSCKNVYMARKTSGRMIIAFVLLVLGNLFLILFLRSFGVLMALVGDGVVLLYLVRESAGRQVIKDGLARIASGELDFKIDEKELIGDNREMAEAVNHVGEGLQNAVRETLKSERLKADLITNVSHDIKTPLTSIINYVDLLKREDIQDPKIRGYIEILDGKSQRLKQLTEDLVEASKISSGNVILDMQPINFGELVWQTNGEFGGKFQARGLEMICRIPEEPVMILADGRRMWRVVENLYNNIAKYAMPNTRVYVEVKKSGNRMIFEVKNISERPLNIQAEELTERFIRGDVSRSTEGSGLGLSIAQNLVKIQNGTFDIYLDGDLFKVTIVFELVQKAEIL